MQMILQLNLVKKKMPDLGVDTMWAVDQTAMFMEYLSKKTIAKKGKKQFGYDWLERKEKGSSLWFWEL
jgi:hypothetical protein